MSSVFQFDSDDVRSARNILEQLAPRVAFNLSRSTTHGVATTIVRNARSRAPVGDNGTLRKAIVAKRARLKSRTEVASDVLIQKGRGAKHDAWYWRFVEFGTGGGKGSHIPLLKFENQTPFSNAQPFMFPAINEMRPKIPQIWREQFGKKMEQLLRRRAKA